LKKAAAAKELTAKLALASGMKSLRLAEVVRRSNRLLHSGDVSRQQMRYCATMVWLLHEAHTVLCLLRGGSETQ
jgi:hypothetical protein